MKIEFLKIQNYFLSSKDVPKRNKSNGKGSVSVHCNNKDYSSTCNILSILCRLLAIYHSNVLVLTLAIRSSNLFVTKPSSQVNAFKLKLD